MAHPEVDTRGTLSAASAAMTWLTHPVTCLALVLLVVNDHVLKQAVGTWWTGKLSDVAWLVVVPPLVATALAGADLLTHGPRLTARTVAVASVMLPGAVFVAVKSTTDVAGLASAVLSSVAGPSRVLADPTDLLTLPALTVSWVVARAAWERRRPEPYRDLRWLVVLPAVVLATTATSSIDRTSVTHVTVVDDVLVVEMTSGPEWDGSTRYLSDDGEQWRDGAASSGSDAPSDSGDPTPRTVGPACAQPAGLECYRAAAEGLGVDTSDDGGVTWTTDWTVPQDVLPELAARYRPAHDTLETLDVDILPTRDGYRVYAANGGDGLAVRDERGTWSRIGFVFEPHAPPVVPLPGEPTTFAHALPVAVTWAAPAALLILALSSRRRSRWEVSSRVVVGRCLTMPGTVLALAALGINVGWSAVEGQEIASDTLALGVGPALAAIVVGSVVALSAVFVAAAVVLLRGRSGWLIAVAALGVAVLGAIPPPPLAAVISVVIVAAGVATVRRATRPPN